VEHEGEPLGGRERFEHHQQRQAYRVDQQRLVLGVNAIRTAHDRLGYVHAQRPFAP
jgi:hypothetical protein